MKKNKNGCEYVRKKFLCTAGSHYDCCFGAEGKDSPCRFISKQYGFLKGFDNGAMDVMVTLCKNRDAQAVALFSLYSDIQTEIYRRMDRVRVNKGK